MRIKSDRSQRIEPQHNSLALQTSNRYTFLTSPIQKGYLSRNYVLHSDEQRYFLKQYRPELKKDDLTAIHAAKSYFAKAKIPIILPLQTHLGTTFFRLNKCFVSLFPLVFTASKQDEFHDTFAPTYHSIMSRMVIITTPISFSMQRTESLTSSIGKK